MHSKQSEPSMSACTFQQIANALDMCWGLFFAADLRYSALDDANEHLHLMCFVEFSCSTCLGCAQIIAVLMQPMLDGALDNYKHWEAASKAQHSSVPSSMA